ncbi:uncharacterized protein EAF02_006948 [Botrytis sinoallii]|uniref:uncharacterized protein n=1 Tax=Botrytis sinoallii TaxID=1463999 RepID=UPI0018FF8716|nr:uncharacterized protein EAF02_006948 [Botrytis sinoallii]KAF7881057.1 hypothetical protein EAF02_006948 [Botrytis sinoallii]
MDGAISQSWGTTFFTMAYIIAVNYYHKVVVLVSCHDTEDPSCATDSTYAACVLDINRDLITATAAVAGIGSLAFGFFTNLPVALARVVEGFIFVFLSLIGMRQWLVKVIPASIKVASGVGIGLFLTETGMSYSAGIGAMTGSAVTPTALGGCPPHTSTLQELALVIR